MKGLAKRGVWVVWTHGPPDHDRARALFNGSDLIARDASRPSDRDSRGAI